MTDVDGDEVPRAGENQNSADNVRQIRCYFLHINLVSTGMNSTNGDAPYLCHGGSSIHRYVCDGEICELPHCKCPNCWADWDFKIENRVCNECGYRLGREVKLMLDSDSCPYCDQGTVTFQSPICTQCGKEVDKTIIEWG